MLLLYSYYIWFSGFALTSPTLLGVLGVTLQEFKKKDEESRKLLKYTEWFVWILVTIACIVWPLTWLCVFSGKK